MSEYNVWSCCARLGLKSQARGRTDKINDRTVINALTYWKNSIPDDLNLRETLISMALILLLRFNDIDTVDRTFEIEKIQPVHLFAHPLTTLL